MDNGSYNYIFNDLVNDFNNNKNNKLEYYLSNKATSMSQSYYHNKDITNYEDLINCLSVCSLNHIPCPYNTSKAGVNIELTFNYISTLEIPCEIKLCIFNFNQILYNTTSIYTIKNKLINVLIVLIYKIKIILKLIIVLKHKIGIMLYLRKTYHFKIKTLIY